MKLTSIIPTLRADCDAVAAGRGDWAIKQNIDDRDGFPGCSPPRVGASDITSPRILIVDDDPGMQQRTVSYFREQNVDAVSAAGRQEMMLHLAATDPSVLILDLRLGDEDGLDLLREIRSGSDIPVIIPTGRRRDDVDRIVGLELGADDYVTRPFNPRELLARVRAVLRRQDMARVVSLRNPEGGGFRFDNWQLATGAADAAPHRPAAKRGTADLE